MIGPPLLITHFLRMLLVLFHQGRLQCRLVGPVPLKCYFSPLSYVRRRPRRYYLEKFLSLASSIWFLSTAALALASLIKVSKYLPYPSPNDDLLDNAFPLVIRRNLRLRRLFDLTSLNCSGNSLSHEGVQVSVHWWIRFVHITQNDLLDNDHHVLVYSPWPCSSRIPLRQWLPYPRDDSILVVGVSHAGLGSLKVGRLYLARFNLRRSVPIECCSVDDSSQKISHESPG